MLVWGGYGGSYLNDGRRYDPATQTWTAMTAINAPSARQLHTAVWSGGQMLLWGGFDASSYLDSGGRYSYSPLLHLYQKP
jgi:N-acetylneuraminic acid mutarotase